MINRRDKKINKQNGDIDNLSDTIDRMRIETEEMKIETRKYEQLKEIEKRKIYCVKAKVEVQRQKALHFKVNILSKF